MDPVKPAVETIVQPAAPVPAVETTTPPAATVSQDDLAAQLAAKDAEITRLATEKENYRLGMLRAKGKLPDEEPDNEGELTVDQKIQKAVQDALYSEKEKKLQAEKDAILAQALRENKEMKTTLANRQGLPDSPDGGTADTQVTTAQYFTPAQIKEFKDKGWDDAKIKKAAENMQNLRGR